MLFLLFLRSPKHFHHRVNSVIFCFWLRSLPVDYIPVPSLLTIQRNAGVGVSMDSWAVVLPTTLEMNPMSFLVEICRWNSRFIGCFNQKQVRWSYEDLLLTPGSLMFFLRFEKEEYQNLMDTKIVSIIRFHEFFSLPGIWCTLIFPLFNSKFSKSRDKTTAPTGFFGDQFLCSKSMKPTKSSGKIAVTKWSIMCIHFWTWKNSLMFFQPKKITLKDGRFASHWPGRIRKFRCSWCLSYMYFERRERSRDLLWIWCLWPVGWWKFFQHWGQSKWETWRQIFVKQLQSCRCVVFYGVSFFLLNNWG